MNMFSKEKIVDVGTVRNTEAQVEVDDEDVA